MFALPPTELESSAPWPVRDIAKLLLGSRTASRSNFGTQRARLRCRAARHDDHSRGRVWTFAAKPRPAATQVRRRPRDRHRLLDVFPSLCPWDPKHRDRRLPLTPNTDARALLSVTGPRDVETNWFGPGSPGAFNSTTWIAVTCHVHRNRNCTPAEHRAVGAMDHRRLAFPLDRARHFRFGAQGGLLASICWAGL
jgi:hypothetical protein